MSVLTKYFTKIPKLTGISTLQNSNRLYSSKRLKVAVCGARGQIGQPLSLILKQSPLIDEIALYDTRGVTGFGIELGHVDTKSTVTAHTGKENIKNALIDSSIVVIVATASKTSHLSHSAMFKRNASIVQDLAKHIAANCPTALVAIASNPVNSLVPIASEVIKATGKYDPNIIFGVTALDVIRANTFVAELLGLDPECVVVPVIGGALSKTIVPLLSHAKPRSDFTIEEVQYLTKGIQNAHFDIVKIKSNHGASLSAAFAIARFVLSLAKGLLGQKNIVECAFVRSKEHPHTKYLSTPLLLGKRGIKENLGIPKLSEYEGCILEKAVHLITADVRRGECFVGVVDPPPCDPCNPSYVAPPCPPNWCQKEDAGCR